MIRINLLPLREAEEAEAQRKELSLVLLGGVLTLVVMGLLWWTQGRQVASLQEQVAEIEQSIEALKSRVDEVKRLETQLADLQAKLRVIAELERKRRGPVQVLSDLSVATPQRLWLTDFSEAGGAATVTGLAVDDQTVSSFLKNLEASRFFANVDLRETRDENGLRRFLLTTQVDYAAIDSAETEAAATEGADR